MVAQAEDDVAAREARASEEVDRRVAAARSNLEREFEERLELIQVEAEGRSAALGAKLDEVTRRVDATRASLGAAQAELASARAEMLLLLQSEDGPRPLHGGTRTRYASGRPWSTCTAPCSASSGKEPTRPWVSSARQPSGNLMCSTMLVTFSSSPTW